jgi:hypothetical protein
MDSNKMQNISPKDANIKIQYIIHKVKTTFQIEAILKYNIDLKKIRKTITKTTILFSNQKKNQI